MQDKVAHKNLRRRHPQGTLVYVGKKRDIKSKYYLFGIKEDTVEAKELDSVYDLIQEAKDYPLFWMHISGLEEEKNVEIVGKTFNIHHILMQDTLNTLNRARTEQIDNHLNVIFKTLEFNTERVELEKGHFSAVLGDKYLISFSEKELFYMNYIHERIQHVVDNKQSLGKDRIFYILLDVIEDGYTEVLEEFEQKVSRFELEVFRQKGYVHLERIYKFKRQELRARKSLLPAREVITTLMKQPNSFISPNVSLYFKDLHDHLIQITDSFETVRETLNGVIDIALSKEAEKTNHVVKILTILSTIFLPLNFLAGMFGMNFEKMPLIGSEKGFLYVALFMMSLTGLSLYIFFKKRWL